MNIWHSVLQTYTFTMLIQFVTNIKVQVVIEISNALTVLLLLHWAALIT